MMEKTKKRKRQVKSADIAIIGMACRFPGAGNYNEYWNNLINGVNSIKEIPPERWDTKQYYSPDIREPNKTVSKWLGLLDGVDRFDTRFFNILPREATVMDPQQRLLLEETWHCMEDSGVALPTLQENVTSVYMAYFAGDYLQGLMKNGAETDNYATLGNLDNFLANRISYTFDFKGNSLPINAACAGFLNAIHEAKLSLRAGESDYAFVGGVNLHLHPWRMISKSKLRMMSPEGQCKTFDKDADGYVPGEGVGVLLLQRLEDAVRDGNHIYGVIKGSNVNHVGHSVSITAPLVEAQKTVMMQTYREANVNPATISYVEAQGTGTTLGDPMEVESLTQAFREYTEDTQFCKIGTVKTNIGHLESASGAASIIKVLMMMKHKKIPPILNLKTINPMIDFASTPFSPPLQAEDWTSAQDGQPLRAAINSMGFGGTNTHMVLEEYTAQQAQPASEPETNAESLFVLSAKTSDSLKQQVRQWRQFAEREEFSQLAVHDVCKTLLSGRESFAYRVGTRISSREDIVAFLTNIDGAVDKIQAQPWSLQVSDVTWKGYPDVERLLNQSDCFRHNLEAVMKRLYRLRPELDELNFQAEQWSDEEQGLYSFLAGCAYVTTLREFGFAPQLITGSSAGVWISLVASGIVKLEAAVEVLSGRRSFEQVQLARPVVPFQDPVSEQLLQPFRFDEDCVRLLVDPLVLQAETENVLVEYVRRARLMIDSQFTFKKIVEDWNGLVRQATGRDIHDLLADEAMLVRGEETSVKEKQLLLLIILCSLRQLNQKWNLSERKDLQRTRLFELVHLVTDEVMTKEALVEILMAEQPDYAAVGELLNQRQSRLQADHPYEFIRAQNKNLSEIQDVASWLEAIVSNQASSSEAANLQVLELATASEDLLATLLHLWLKGTEIDWRQLAPEGTFAKLPLPGYNFEQKSFWQAPMGAAPEQPRGEVAVVKPPETRQEIVQQQQYMHNQQQRVQQHVQPQVCQQMVNILSSLIQIPADQLETDVDIRQYGLDSIKTVEYSEQLSAYFQTFVNPILVYQYPTIQDLADHLVLNSAWAEVAVAREEAAPADEPAPVAEPTVDRKKLQTVLFELLADVLGVDHNEIEADTDLRELGLNSVSLTAFADNINGRLNTDINSALLFQYTNMQEIVGYVADTHPQLGAEFATAAPTASAHSVATERKVEVARPAAIAPGAQAPQQHTGGRRDIAIIGMSGRFPGSSNTREFWENLVANRDMITEVPADRWSWQEIYGDPHGMENKTMIKWGGFLNDIKSFDASFFKISPKEAKLMDPQQRLALEETWHVIEDAGYKPSALSGTKTGVFLGVFNNDYRELLLKNNVRLDAYSATGTYFSILPNRISYQLNLVGPSVAIETACSGSLVAIHQAVQAIQNGDCTMAIAGGVNINSTPTIFMSFNHAGMLAEDGRCKTYDKSANGYVRGEGVGMILLKELSQAEQDGDQIYAVIKGSAVNHGGYANSLTAPNPNLQAELIVTAWQRAGITPDTVTYMEAHGTGTSLGDPIEINGLKKAFADLYQHSGKKQVATGYCDIGTAKTSIGHLESAAGIAGIIKVLLSMKHQQLTGNIHLKDVNPYVQVEGSPFALLHQNKEWRRLVDENGQAVPRRAGVSSFGFGGANAHIVLEEYEQPAAAASFADQQPKVIVLSAKHAERLQEYAKDLHDYLHRYVIARSGEQPLQETVSLADLAYTLQVGREAMDERLALIVSSVEELVDKLAAFCKGKQQGADMYSGNVKDGKKTSELLLDGEEGDEFVRIVFSKGRLDKIAQLWVMGVDVDWQLLYGAHRPRRVSLPGYAFEKRAFWFDSGVQAAPVAPAPQAQLVSREPIFTPAPVAAPVTIPAPAPTPVTVDVPVPAARRAVSNLERVQQTITSIIGEVLHLHQDEMDPETGFKDLGIDSISGIELIRRLNSAFNLNLEAVVIYDYSNIDCLSRHVSEHVTLQPETVAAPAEDKLTNLLQQLQDEELDLDELDRFLEEIL